MNTNRQKKIVCMYMCVSDPKRAFEHQAEACSLLVATNKCWLSILGLISHALNSAVNKEM